MIEVLTILFNIIFTNLFLLINSIYLLIKNIIFYNL